MAAEWSLKVRSGREGKPDAAADDAQQLAFFVDHGPAGRTRGDRGVQDQFVFAEAADDALENGGEAVVEQADQRHPVADLGLPGLRQGPQPLLVEAQQRQSRAVVLAGDPGRDRLALDRLHEDPFEGMAGDQRRGDDQPVFQGDAGGHVFSGVFGDDLDQGRRNLVQDDADLVLHVVDLVGWTIASVPLGSAWAPQAIQASISRMNISFFMSLLLDLVEGRRLAAGFFPDRRPVRASSGCGCRKPKKTALRSRGSLP